VNAAALDAVGGTRLSPKLTLDLFAYSRYIIEFQGTSGFAGFVRFTSACAVKPTKTSIFGTLSRIYHKE
jgi:hypothetical protein